jgi:cytochrome c551/c552
MRGQRGLSSSSIAVAMICLVGLVACDDTAPASPAPACLDGGVDTSCTPAYEPTYDALYANTLHPTCAKSGVSCHASTGKQAGLNFDDADDAYKVLTAQMVRPGEPACSVLVHRIVADTGTIRMPPGRSLPPGEQCAIIKWVADGAKR